MFERFTKDRRTLPLGAAVVVLALVATIEGGYIAWHRNATAPDRYKLMNAPDEWYGYIAFDTATGQACRTVRVWKPSPAANSAPESQPSKSGDDQRAKGDPILDAIRGRYDAEAAEKAAAAAAREKAEDAEFFQSLPLCGHPR